MEQSGCCLKVSMGPNWDSKIGFQNLDPKFGPLTLPNWNCLYKKQVNVFDTTRNLQQFFVHAGLWL